MPNSACGTPLGQTMRATSIACACPGRSARHRAGDQLLLPQQPRSHLDLAADAEGVDPLIAGVLLRPQANHLPVVAAAALSQSTASPDRSATPTRSSTPSPVTSSTPSTDAADARRPAPRDRCPSPATPAAPDGTRRQQVQRAVVVEVGGHDPRPRLALSGGREPARFQDSSAAPLCQDSHGPLPAGAARTPKRSVLAQRHHLEAAVGVEIGDGQRHRRAESRHRRFRREDPGLPVEEHAQRARRVEERGVRIGVAVEIRPREGARTGRRRQTTT